MAGTEGATDARPPSDEVVAMIRIPTRPGQIKEVIAVLRSVVGPSLAQPSCRECDVAVDAIEDRYVLFHERWSSLQDFERHVRSDLYERVLSVLEMASEVPEARFESRGVSSRREGCARPETRRRVAANRSNLCAVMRRMRIIPVSPCAEFLWLPMKTALPERRRIWTP